VTLEGIFLARPEAHGDGIRLAVKDLLDTAGLTTTYGSILFADHVPDRSAEAVLRLESAGYQNVGKTNLHEFAYGVTSQNPHFGTVPNPVARGRIAGGSSGGSAAALAAGLADAALGSDSGGSIRIPAACCGIVGFKPTYGLVPSEGCFPLAPSFDHVGPMARSVAECRAMMAALVPGFAGVECAVEEVQVGVAWLDRCDELVRMRVTEAASCFPTRREIDFPLADGPHHDFMREAAESHGGLFPEHGDAYGEDVRTKLERCFAVTDREAEAGERARDEHRARAEEAAAGVDVLVLPTLAFVAPSAEIRELEVRDDLIRFTYPLNSLGWPALALPCGPAEHGFPASLQLVGRPGDDALVLALGEALEAELASLDRGRPDPL
jgi:aspartyl-tRNA(Asn)/glutamyl-tRNA(Gln) amidotransferase subunit A